MNAQYVCPGCSCLCDDIELELDEESRIKTVCNACLKGAMRFLNYNKNRAQPTMDGEVSDIDMCIEKAAALLRDAENPMIFGMDNSSVEAQQTGIKLARKLHARMDDSSSFCQGLILERIFSNEIKTCTLDEVRDESDVLVYWGSDTCNSHPRHISKFTYLPRGKHRQKGWEVERTPICIDVWKSNTAEVCKRLYQIPPGEDARLMNDIMSMLSDKVPENGLLEIKQLAILTKTLQKAEHGTIFPGLGLLYSIRDNIDLLVQFMEQLNHHADFHLIPMVGHYNMRGFNQTLHKETGHLNKVQFTGTKQVEHEPENALLESLKNNSIDTILIIGSDPLSSAPLSIARKLLDINTIVIEPYNTPTTRHSDVVIPCAVTGIESGGTAVRMDGAQFKLEQAADGEYPDDGEILKRLLEAV